MGFVRRVKVEAFNLWLCDVSYRNEVNHSFKHGCERLWSGRHVVSFVFYITTVMAIGFY